MHVRSGNINRALSAPAMATVQQKPRGTVRGARSVKQSTKAGPLTTTKGSSIGAASYGSNLKSSRRSFQAVDTNVAAYDRTDPFAAVNALRKLLTVLPSRTGGNKLKLAVEEHTLAMQLLTIVEPFIGLEPSKRRSLTRQPTEILDEVASHVDSKRDLLALGLTCKRLADVVFPRHFAYRVVRAKFSNLAVWHHLTVHRTLARNVRQLELLDERAPASSVAVPPELRHQSDTDLEASSSDEEGTALQDRQMRVFVGALAKMTRLDAFVWSCGHPLVSLLDVWPTLLRWCATLRTFQINDAYIFNSKKDSDASEDDIPKGQRAGKRHLALPRLSSVSVHSVKKGFGQVKKPELTDVVEILHSCPNLEELNLKYTPFKGAPSLHVDSLFQFGRWPFLRALYLTNVACSTEGLDAAGSFLASHDGLEVLHLNEFSSRAFDLSPGALPRLRELRSTKDFASRIMACPLSADDTNNAGSRPLETLEGMRLTGPGCDTFLDGLRKHPVKKLVLAGYGECEDVRKLVECVPQVTYLDMGRKTTTPLGTGAGSAAPGKTNSAAGTSATIGTISISNVNEWLDLLAPLPNLVTFHGVRFFYAVSENVLSTSSSSNGSCANTIPGTSISAASNASDRSRLRKNDEIASLLAWKCPKLRRVDHWEDVRQGEVGKVIVLSRDGTSGAGGGRESSEKVKWEVRRVLRT
ncbi:hypothetical protein SCHPADRAFT_876960 [Schizopora paradoxa]|uniref:F-box domain-containing protein n=1 Tax=Schizopora paradoxa TaxID=27342 RepID=A0A0H2S318_9AGAM|nr:hypothetical protein SCHPADRAFT_876960 [Schizopora paradoxa]